MKKNLLPFVLLVFSLAWNKTQAQWTSLGSGISVPQRALAGIAPLNENTIWGFTWHASQFVPTHEFTRTTDGGQTWHPGTLTGVDSDQFSFYIFPLDGQTAWLSTADEKNPIKGKIYKTTDGGTNWVHQSTGFAGINETPTGIHFWNANEGMAYGATGETSFNDQISVYTTTDGGNQWTKVVAPNMPAQLSAEGQSLYNFAGFFSVVGDTVWFGTTKKRVFRSTDRGKTWQVFSTPLTSSNYIGSLGFRDGQTGLALGYNPLKLARSTDGGETWSLLPLTVPSNFRGAQIEYVPGTRSTWIMVTGPAKYMVSYDDGDTWETFNSNIEVWSMEFLNAKTGFSASYINGPEQGGAYRWGGAPLGNRWFVNDDASGANSGSNWTDAFTDLQSALAVAGEGDQIWVAKGTYKPAAANGDPLATFLIDKDIKLYGGFVGTESTLAQRGDPAANPSILSGDLNGDDLPGNFLTNRGDNVEHVIQVTGNVTNETLIDGFEIQNGHADGFQMDQQRGGGLYAFGSLVIRNCIFKENFAKLNGGGMIARNLSVTADGDFIEVDNCTFENNQTGSDGGGLSFVSLGQNSTYLVTGCQFNENTAASEGGGFAAGVSPNSLNATFAVNDCQFNQNEANVGGGVKISSVEAFSVTGCTFSGNKALSGSLQASGGGLHIGQSSGQVNHCTFLGNQSALFGGGMTVIDYTGSPGNIRVDVSDCVFESNSAGRSDGGLSLNSWVNNNNYSAKRCVFKQNSAIENGGGLGIYAQRFSNNAKILIDSCTFFQNHADNVGGASFTIAKGKNMGLDFNRCSFIENTAVLECGAADFWSTDDGTGALNVDSCLFEKNAAFVAGAFAMGGGHGSLVTAVNYQLTNTTVQENQATALGGGALIWATNKAMANFIIENCLFENNHSAGDGGGIYFLPEGTVFNATVRDTRILGNQSSVAGGAADISKYTPNIPFPTNASLHFENCLITGNTSTGAAISADSVPNLTFINSTIANNTGGGIQLSDQSGINLQNTILYNPGYTELKALTNDVTFKSSGGNLIGDLSLNSQLLASDRENLNPVFAGAGDYHLAAASPGIDKGVDLGNLSATDLDGNPRVNGCVDIGAYESPVTVSSECVVDAGEVVASGLLRLSPNPASDFLNMELPENMMAEQVSIQVFDATGKIVLESRLDAGKPLELRRLVPGIHSLKAIAGDRVFSGKFVKI